eukprot:CAMPEP_0172493924 /NCGR_PEP_ID=MMETSP1066-20121228/32808_1 /TAXON_ID=671091 /ORGANISM="Coscinodiscus wailesii, Strain CCMP2513" /LENGTH=80 /DNA_ID=CAMNT_0013264407 /DNA_START=56 /DNA_END=295 /DNA_ORIENTATION=-
MMKLSSAALCLLLLTTPSIFSAASTGSSSSDVLGEDSVEADNHPLLAKFENWIAQHEKKYDTHEDFLERFAIWLENDAYI